MNPHEFTNLIELSSNGDGAATDALLPLVYEELHRLAASALSREPAGLTLQPTALVHEVYLRLVGTDMKWQGRRPFFFAAATAIRRILVDRARRYQAGKHGGGRRREDYEVASDDFADKTPVPGDSLGGVDVIRLHEALIGLEKHDPRQAEVVLLRYFGGMSVEQTALALDVSTSTVKNDWAYARAWLRRSLEQQA